MIGDATYERDGNDLQARGLYLDEPPWRAHVFSLTQRDGDAVATRMIVPLVPDGGANGSSRKWRGAVPGGRDRR